ncbi:DUF4870 family protein [Thioalkalivibrio sulfidiphilus]|uniref:Transmembrane protein n=1 Tax=Thioalkalivibrio sulfidiphilus (strain HL-EbGR7) TaxID=396588 RepID=B8GQH7_THISH|nr:DUF4870 domain-containing protein [Thioalkalivibrio sulfidiphilus]ACL74201.1 conserved hypothetical protein [Thioalkalivibrio sulfidiphilus HL-EbGr7]
MQEAPAEQLKSGPVMIIYVLYFVGFFIGLTALVGVIMAHMKRGEADAAAQSHYQYQIRTFWIGLIYMIVGVLTAMLIIGYLILLWWFVWTLVRCIKGVLRALDNKPMENPETLLW